MLSQESILDALKAVKYPGYSRDIISFGLVKDVSVANGAVSVAMQLTSPNVEAAFQLKAESEAVLKKLPGVNHVLVEVRQPAAGQGTPTNPFASQNKVRGVKRIIAIASGKGGERNGHHYSNGFAGQGAGDAEQRAFLTAHPDLYNLRDSVVRLHVSDGMLDLRSLDQPGFASGAEPLWDSLAPLQSAATATPVH